VRNGCRAWLYQNAYEEAHKASGDQVYPDLGPARHFFSQPREMVPSSYLERLKVMDPSILNRGQKSGWVLISLNWIDKLQVIESDMYEPHPVLNGIGKGTPLKAVADIFLHADSPDKGNDDNRSTPSGVLLKDETFDIISDFTPVLSKHCRARANPFVPFSYWAQIRVLHESE
jgi:hypothetical protein